MSALDERAAALARGQTDAFLSADAPFLTHQAVAAVLSCQPRTLTKMVRASWAADLAPPVFDVGTGRRPEYRWTAYQEEIFAWLKRYTSWRRSNSAAAGGSSAGAKTAKSGAGRGRRRKRPPITSPGSKKSLLDEVR